MLLAMWSMYACDACGGVAAAPAPDAKGTASRWPSSKGAWGELKPSAAGASVTDGNGGVDGAEVSHSESAAGAVAAGYVD